MKATRIVTAFAVMTLIAASAQAQTPGKFSLELRGGAALPTKDLGPAQLKTGANVEMTANFQVMPHLNLYAGWDYGHFTFKEKLGVFEDVDDTGYAFGARFFAPSLGKVTPWLRAGGVFDHVELEGASSDDYVSGDHKLGWEAGAGAAIALGGRWSLLPGVRYRAFSPEVNSLSDADMSYVIVDIGISATFGGKPLAAIGHR